MLPPELWEIILKRLDNPFELIKLQTVTKNWHDIIENLISRSARWREMCSDTMYYAEIFCIMEKVFPSAEPWKFSRDVLQPNELKGHIWRDIYRSYKKWQLWMVYPSTINTIADFLSSADESITYMDIWGENLAIV